MRPVLLIYERVANKLPVSQPSDTNVDNLSSKFSNLSLPSQSSENEFTEVASSSSITVLPLANFILWLVVTFYHNKCKDFNPKQKDFCKFDIYDVVFTLFHNTLMEVKTLHDNGNVINNCDKTKTDISQNTNLLNKEYFTDFIQLDKTELSCMYVQFDLAAELKTADAFNIKFDKIISKINDTTKKGVDLYIIIRNFYFAIDCARTNYIKKYLTETEEIAILIFNEMSEKITSWHNFIYKEHVQKIGTDIPETDHHSNIYSRHFKQEKSNIENADMGLFFKPLDTKLIKKIEQNINIGTYLSIEQQKKPKKTFDDLVRQLAACHDIKQFTQNLQFCLDYSASKSKRPNSTKIQINYILCPFTINENGSINNVTFTNNKFVADEGILLNPQYMNDGQGNIIFSKRKPNNCKFVENDIITTAEINEGDELLVDYGESYWASHDHNYLQYEDNYITSKKEEEIFETYKTLKENREIEVNKIRKQLNEIRT